MVNDHGPASQNEPNSVTIGGIMMKLLDVGTPASGIVEQESAVAGSWAFRSASRSWEASGQRVGDTVLRGAFFALEEPTDGGYRWQVEVTDDSPRGPDLPLLDTGSGRPSASRLVLGVKRGEHMKLMAALRGELEARYGPAEELMVLFHRNGAGASSLVPRFVDTIPWWRRIWLRTATE